MTTIKLRRGTAAAWTSANPTLAAGEVGYETDTGKMKIGNGATAWTSLGYTGAGIDAPFDADYLVRTANAGLSAERVVTDTPSVTWDWATGGQAKANLVAWTGDVTINPATNAASINAGVIISTDLAASFFDTDATLAANSATRVPAQSAVKSYVDNAVAGLRWKSSVRVATTANGALATAYENADTVDGIALATGDRILLKNQTTGSENGIYTVNASGAPTRSTDFDTSAEAKGATVLVEQGTTNADTIWTCTTESITLGTTALVFAQVSGAGTYVAGAGLSLTANSFAVSSPELVAFLSLSSAADRLAYYTGSGTAALATFTAFARTLLDDVDAAAMRTTLGLVIGTNVQAYDAELAALAGLTSANNKVPYFTGSGTAGLLDASTVGKEILNIGAASEDALLTYNGGAATWLSAGAEGKVLAIVSGAPAYSDVDGGAP